MEYRSNRGGDRGGRSNYGGDRGGRRSFGGGRRDFGGGRPEMFSTVCDNCGKDCEVPFKPSQDKPVYCSDCFRTMAPQRDDRGSRDNRSSRRDSYSDRGDSFRPRESSSSNNAGDIAQLKEQLNSISAKLDKLVRILTPVETEVVSVEEKPKKVTKRAKKEVIVE